MWEDIDKAIGIEDAVKEFEDMHNVTVEIIEKPFATQIEDLRLDGPGGTGPDVFTMPADQVGTAVTEGLLQELQVDKTITSLYSEASMQSQTVDDYLICRWTNSNEHLFNEGLYGFDFA